MKIAFREVNFRRESIDRINLCNQIIEDYMGQGLRLTLRQLYYQLVTRNAVPNVERSYKMLSNLISEARLAGLVDWNAIEDRGRRPRGNNEYTGLPDLVEAAIHSYRLPRWEGQKYYAELWVEKDALAGVLSPLASEYHVKMMVNRGYSSQTAMYEAADRFLAECGDKQPILFYLGDHDPSGEDMVRDIEDRLKMFGVHEIIVEKLALTMAQVQQYNPPPNPAKMTDPRASNYISQHGSSSWEVDALPPEVLSGIIRRAFKRIVNVRKMNVIKRKEEADKKRLRRLVKTNSK